MKYLKYLVLVVVYLILIVSFSLIHNPLNNIVSNNGMYFLHVLEYFILSFLFLGLFRGLNLKYSYLFAILCCGFIGILTEIFQIFISYRVFNPYDIISDVIGASLILIFYKK